MDDGAIIGQWACNLGARQAIFLWQQQPVGGGYYKIINKATNKCMQVNGASNDDGATISQWDCVDQPNVYWQIPPVSRTDDSQ